MLLRVPKSPCVVSRASPLGHVPIPALNLSLGYCKVVDFLSDRAGSLNPLQLNRPLKLDAGTALQPNRIAV